MTYIDMLEREYVGGFGGMYEITSCGKVISHYRKEPYLMSIKVKDNFYHFIQLTFMDVVGKNLYIHRLVANHFIRPLLVGEEVDHLDGDKTNNKISNLAIVSSKGNHKNRVKRHGGGTL